MKMMTVLILSLLFASCSRSLKKDYKVVDASKKEIPEWVEDLAEWLDDEEDDDEQKKHRYYIYSTEPKNSQSMSCELAKAKAASSVAAEVSTYIKDSLATSMHGDPTKKNAKLSEYIQNDLYKEVQTTIVGAQVYRNYWEKRRYMKDKGAADNWDGFVCTALIKISKDNLNKAFKRTEDKLAKLASDNKAKEQVKKIMQEAAEKY